MRGWIWITMLGGLLAAGAPAIRAARPAASASESYRLESLQPNAGQARMSSSRYRLEAVVSPPLSGAMDSSRFRIRALSAPRPPVIPGKTRRLLILSAAVPR